MVFVAVTLGMEQLFGFAGIAFDVPFFNSYGSVLSQCCISIVQYW